MISAPGRLFALLPFQRGRFLALVKSQGYLGTMTGARQSGKEDESLRWETVDFIDCSDVSESCAMRPT